MYHRQTGLSMMGFIFVSLAIILLAVLGFKVGPAYLEFYSVKKILSTMSEEDTSFSVKDLRESFNRRANVAYIQGIDGKDLQISKENNTITLGLDYTRQVHLFGNVNACLDFATTASLDSNKAP